MRQTPIQLPEAVRRSLGTGRVHPTVAMNTLIELDNRRGLLGLWGLEGELRDALPRLQPRAQALARAWLEALELYREAHYPRHRVSRFLRQQMGLGDNPWK